MNLMTEQPLWQHVKIHLKKSDYHRFLDECGTKLIYQCDQASGYFDCIQFADEYQIILHRIKSASCLLQETKKRLQENKFIATQCYQVAHNEHGEIAELLAGSQANKFYKEFSQESLTFLFHWIEQIQHNPKNKMRIALDLMMNHLLIEKMQATYFKNNYPSSFISYRSHADGFFIRTNKEEQVRKQMELIYQKNKSTYHLRFNQLNHGLHIRSNDSLYDWNIFLGAVIKQIEYLIANNLLYFNNNLDGFIADHYQVSAKNLHAQVQGDYMLHNYVTRNKSFQISRLLSGLLYLTLHRLGLTLNERYLLCHIISRTIEDLYEVTPALALRDIRNHLIKNMLKKILTLGIMRNG